MNLVAIAHVALPVASLEKSLDFYENVLGLTALERPDFGFPGAWLQLGGQQVHLMELGPVTPDARQHFAVQVTDAEAIAAELEAHGIKASRSFGLPAAGKQVFIADPDGHQIEFNQPQAT